MFTKKKIVKIIHENIKEIKTYGVKRIGIFGSVLKSTQNSRSDVDILVEFKEEGKIFDNYMNLKFYLEKLLHREVDLVIKDTLKPQIKRTILKEVAYA